MSAKFKADKIKQLLNQFDDLSVKEKLDLVEHIFSNEEIELNDSIGKFIEEFQETIEMLILKENYSIEEIRGIFIDKGFQNLITEILMEYISRYADNLLNIPSLKAINKDDLLKICNFVINNFILYDNYTEIKFNQFKKTLSETNKDYIQSTFDFIITAYNNIALRVISPDVLRSKLLDYYLLEKDTVEIIMEPIIGNVDGMHWALMQKNIAKLTNA